MSKKSEIKIILPHFYKTIQTEFQTTIKNVHTNNGGEISSSKRFLS